MFAAATLPPSSLTHLPGRHPCYTFTRPENAPLVSFCRITCVARVTPASCSLPCTAYIALQWQLPLNSTAPQLDTLSSKLAAVCSTDMPTAIPCTSHSVADDLSCRSCSRQPPHPAAALLLLEMWHHAGAGPPLLQRPPYLHIRRPLVPSARCSLLCCSFVPVITTPNTPCEPSKQALCGICISERLDQKPAAGSICGCLWSVALAGGCLGHCQPSRLGTLVIRQSVDRQKGRARSSAGNSSEVRERNRMGLPRPANCDG